ncbi:MAG TPA: DUF4386 domain-containing protein [Gemmatimonadaceae bacterium]|nr:DUF4386 domain-containing protein [Gemmatimonadaceae bacterium]
MNGIDSSNVQKYARFAGLLFLISIAGGWLGELYIPSQLIVTGDATETAANIRESALLLRIGFATYLIEAICDITLAWALYVLLKPVDKNLALLAAFFGLVSTATFAGMEHFYFASLYPQSGAEYLKTFTPAQLDSLSLLMLKLYGGGLFMAFYGLATGIRGYLIYRSKFLPAWLGVIMMIAGSGFILKNFTLVLVPDYSSDFFLLPTFLTAVSMAFWLLIKGVDVAKWEAEGAN